MFRGDRRPLGLVCFVAVILVALGGCRQKMADQPSYTPLQASEFFEDGMASRTPVPGTVAVGQLREDEVFYTGKLGEEFVDTFPGEVSIDVLRRGRERFEIYCSVCHGRRGDADGMIVQRGYRKPPSFHTDDSRSRAVGYFFDVMTNGFGVMPSYSGQISPEDRWAIAAWIRTLQFSQNARLEDVPPSIRDRLMGGEEVVFENEPPAEAAEDHTENEEAGPEADEQAKGGHE